MVRSIGQECRNSACSRLFPRAAALADGQQVAVERSETSGIRNIWIIDLVRGAESRETSGSVDNGTPIFSPDGQKIVFAADRSGAQGLYVKAASGLGAEQLLQRVVVP